MAGQPLRIGVVGVGFGAQVHLPGLQSEGLDVVADNASWGGGGFGATSGYPKMWRMIRAAIGAASSELEP